jgi:hypothetical protein
LQSVIASLPAAARIAADLRANNDSLVAVHGASERTWCLPSLG